MNSYIYTFIREDLSPEQRIVQLGHACHEAGKLLDPNEHTEPSTMALLSAKNEDDLICIAEHLDERGIEYHMFYEPDISSYTAICTRPIVNDKERAFFRKWKLFKHTT